MQENHNTPPIIIDVEASGFGRGSYPIEIGLALSQGDTRCFLIQPAEHWTHWDSNGERLHGITRELLHSRGLPIVEVAKELNRLLAGQTVYSDGWGVDSAWIGKLFDEADLPQLYTIEQLQRLFSEQQFSHWHQSHEKVSSLLNIQRHRASSDALLIQQTFLHSAQNKAKSESLLNG